ncbi:hypothetical protein Tter_1590 [Thermobaculum terrenum ATCC BAA-798]|uniref:Uncharacterized protein n=1 Tax=Thermobaculum terrenum (strain ATCC BAA-798 / CCMEE 7001 / YNP1) TaxID=525904 RepID=D1CCI1_THET1|nr:hypothetical protein [Thermobaculum terrenum]ACZ42496.1 hypothetical protein Tter_1590 [Thermobaculum terrenum ATCC BAA-798]
MSHNNNEEYRFNNFNVGDIPEPEHEDRDVNVRGIVIAGVAIAFGAFIVFVVSAFLLNWLTSRGQQVTQVPSVSPLPTLQPANPPLQVNEPADLKALREEEDKKLNTYQWIDRNKGIVQIPIDRAMEIIANENLRHEQGKTYDDVGKDAPVDWRSGRPIEGGK